MAQKKTTLIYLLERFPADTLNFVYNEVTCLERAGFGVEIFSLLPSESCPEEAKPFLSRTRNVRPVGKLKLVQAMLYYLVRRPFHLACLFLRFPFENTHGRLAKGARTVGHLAYGVYFAWLLRGRHEHVHAHFAFKAATAALVAHRLNGVSFSFTAHGSATVYAPSQYSLRTKIRDARFIIAVSRFNKRVMETVCPEAAPGKIIVNRTGVLLGQFPYSGTRERGPEFKILCLASLYPVKNHAGLIEACGILKSRGVNFSLELVGKDDLGRGPMLQQLVAANGIEENVLFSGSIDHGEIREVLGRADVCILTSFSEGIPVSLMEAMACGLPVIGPNVTGVPELIKHGESGYLVDPHSPADIADSLLKILENPGLARAMGESGRAQVEEFYDMQNNARELASIFQERLNG